MRPLAPMLTALVLSAALLQGCGAKPPGEPASAPSVSSQPPRLPEPPGPQLQPQPPPPSRGLTPPAHSVPPLAHSGESTRSEPPALPASPETAAAAPSPTTLAAAVGLDRNGPWQPVRDGSVLPPDHRWLRLVFSRLPGEVVLRNGMQALNLPLEREGEATLHVNLEQAPAYVTIDSPRDAGGNPVEPPFLRLIRGKPPIIWSRSPAGGEPRVLATLDAMPTEDALSRWKPPAPPVSPARLRFEEFWNLAVSPDGRYLALLEKPRGPFNPAGRLEAVDLRIYDQTTRSEVLGVQQAVQVLQGIPPCTGGRSALVWRPDGTAVAAVGVGEGVVQLVLFAVQGGPPRVLAERPGTPYESNLLQVVWSPSGRHLVFGDQLLDAASGQSVATLPLGDRSRHLFFWSPNGDYLLSASERVFLDYGPMYLTRAEDGHQEELGYGKALGWTAAGEAVYLVWETARDLKLDGPKDCG